MAGAAWIFCSVTCLRSGAAVAIVSREERSKISFEQGGQDHQTWIIVLRVSCISPLVVLSPKARHLGLQSKAHTTSRKKGIFRSIRTCFLRKALLHYSEWFVFGWCEGKVNYYRRLNTFVPHCKCPSTSRQKICLEETIFHHSYESVMERISGDSNMKDHNTHASNKKKYVASLLFGTLVSPVQQEL